MRILIVEDDALLGAAICSALGQAGYEVRWEQTGEAGLAAIRAESFSAVLLDIGLPRGDGLSVLRRLRSERNTTPVIIVSAQDRSERKVEGLDAGADDYLVKPFELDELLARVRARLRRGEARASELITVGHVRLDLVGRIATLDGAAVPLAAREFKLLSLLMSRAGRFVSKGEIEGALYDEAAELQSNTVESAIYALRRKFGADFIITARGLGYMTPR